MAHTHMARARGVSLGYPLRVEAAHFGGSPCLRQYLFGMALGVQPRPEASRFPTQGSPPVLGVLYSYPNGWWTHIPSYMISRRPPNDWGCLVWRGPLFNHHEFSVWLPLDTTPKRVPSTKYKPRNTCINMLAEPNVNRCGVAHVGVRESRGI